MVFNKMAAKPRRPPESPPKNALQWVLICPILCESFMKKAVLVSRYGAKKKKVDKKNNNNNNQELDENQESSPLLR